MKTLLIALLLCVCLLSVSATQSQKPAWEYKVETGVAEGKLNSLASQGWEVAAAGNYNGGMPYVILKRIKQ